MGLLAIFHGQQAIQFYKVLVGHMLAAIVPFKEQNLRKVRNFMAKISNFFLKFANCNGVFFG